MLSSGRERGAVALEALLSITLILGVVVTIWSTAAVLYNLSVLSGAAKAAAEMSLIAYNRSAYRGGIGPESYAIAEATAYSVMTEGTRGLLAGRFGTRAEALPIDFQLSCAASYAEPFSTANCADPALSRIEKVDVEIVSPIGILLSSPLGEGGLLGDLILRAHGEAFAAGPEAAP